MDLGEIREKASAVYFALEDKYYAALDKLQPKVPVYSVVDPVDKVVPSFGIILAVVVALFGFGLFSLAGGLFSGGGVELTATFTDAAGSPVSNVLVSLEKNGEVIFSQSTNVRGEVVLSASAGEYELRALKDGYTSIFESITLNRDTSQAFTLKELVSAAKQRALLIQDASGNVLGILSPVSISLSFSCQTGTPPANQTALSGNVTFLQPGNCINLSVSIDAAGFISKTQPILGDSTIITMQSTASLDPPAQNPTGGTVEIIAKNTDGSPIEQAQIKLYKVPAAGSNVLVQQSLSDPNGLSVFESVTPGSHVVVVSKSGYKQTTSAAFQVNAGETVSQTITVPISSNKRKVFVKIVSSLNQLPVSGAQVTLFVLGAEGNYIEYDVFSSDSNGMVNQPLADFNGTTQLVVEHDNFVWDVSQNTGIVPEDQGASIPIVLEPLQAVSGNGTIANAFVLSVKVQDEVGLPVLGAEVRVHTPDENGVSFSPATTNAQGIAKFSNLPAGSYQASASTANADGVSAVIQGNAGQAATLPVTLTLGNALVKVTVKDELNAPVADANVSIYALSNDALKSRGTTNAQGIVQLGVSTGQQVYVRVEKASYLPFVSVPFDIIKNNTHSINIEVSLTNASQAADISLQRIDQIAANGSVSLAQSFVSDGLYALRFSVKSLVSQSALKAVVRLNGDDATPLSLSDVGRILGGQAAEGGLSFYTTHNPSDVFAPLGVVDSNTPAKVSINSVGDVNGAAAYEWVVFVKIKSGAQPQVDKLDVRFQAKSNSNASAQYFESFTIGQPLNQSNYSFVFFVTPPGSSTPIQLNPAIPLVVEKDLDYSISYQIANTSGTNQPNASLTLAKDVQSLSTSVNSISTPMNNNASASGSFTLRSTVACSSGVSHCATLTATLNGLTGVTTSPSFPIKVFTTPAKSLFLSVSPSFLIPAQAQSVQVVVRDQLNALAGPAQGVLVQGQIKDAAGQNIGSSIAFTPSPFNIFSGAIPASPNGSVLEITASASGYFSDVEIIPITNQIILNFSQDFSCLTLTPVPNQNPLTFAQGSSGTLRISTSNCPAGLKLYSAGFAPAVGSAIKLDMKDPSAGNVLITSTNPLSLAATATKDVTISNPSNSFGMYPLYIYAKYDNQPPASSFALVKNVDVLVQPVTGSANCLNLSKYVFDVADGSDAASVVNNCNPLVHDAFLPKVTLPVNGVYGHAVPTILTPEMQNPSASISFDYTIDVDYNSTRSPRVKVNDFTQDPPIIDGNWTRYIANNATQFLDERSDYVDAQGNALPGIVQTIIPDSQLYNGNFYLEATSVPSKFPWSLPVSKRSVLFETTFILEEGTTIDSMCFASSGLNNIIVKIDGEVVQSTFSSGCTQTNRYFAPGPHSIQIFTYKATAAGYSIIVKYKDLPYTSNTTCGVHTCASDFTSLSSKANPGFFLSGAYGMPYSNGLNQNGSYTVTETAALVPSANNYIPTSSGAYTLSTEGKAIGDILLNAGKIDHTKQTYLTTTTNNPSIRAFVHGDEVHAQFVGFDNPSVIQNVFVENTALDGEQYGVVTLEDYSLGSPSASKNVDVGVLIDASSSVILSELNEPASSTQSGAFRQEGLCQTILHLKDSLEYYSGATVNLRIAFMGDLKNIYPLTGAPTLPCASEFPNPIVLNSTPFTSQQVPNATYTEGVHDVNEAWAWAAEKFATHAFWSAPHKVMVVITDNKPSGLGKNVTNDAWEPALEQALVTRAATQLQSVGTTGIRGVVLYRTPLESISTSSGDPSKLDAIEMFDAFAQGTNGFVEALESSELINIQNPFVWEHASNNKVGVRLAQTIFPRAQQTMVVKLISTPANACIGENGEIGETGPSAFPHIFYDWRWSAVQKDSCDANPLDAANFKYCDATQFTISLVKKLEELKSAYAPSATPAQVAQIPSLTQFDTYLMYDGLSTDFRNDFVEFFDTSTFSDAPAYFKSTLQGQWKDYVSDPTRLSFEIDGEPAVKIPTPGLYRAHIQILWDGGTGEFFLASSPHARVKVVLTKLANASSLSGYTELLEIPFDGIVGVDDSQNPITFHRDGYGTAFTGTVIDLVPTPGLTLRSYPNQPNNTALNTYSIPAQPDAVTLNTFSRGELFRIDRVNGVLHIRPSIPTPLAAEWSSNALGKGDVYYAVKETSSPTFISAPSLLKWTPYASVVKQPTLSCVGNNCAICTDGGTNPYISSVALDSNPTPGLSCGLTALPQSSSTNFFGFTSTDKASNSAYLSSIFYRAPGLDYTLYMGCTPNQSKPTGSFLTPNGIVDGSPSTIPLDNGSVAVEDLYNQATSFAGMLGLVSSQDTCISNTNGKTTIYWNSEKIRGSLTNGSSFGAGHACTATGSPFGVAGLFTLNERANDPVFSVPPASGFLGFCPLFNANDSSNGYFGQYGAPYPVGTKIFFPSTGPITQDPDNGLIQYRYNPSQCSNLPGTDCPISPGLTANDTCGLNTERYWSGIPYVNP